MELVKSVSIENMVNQRAAVVARLNQALDLIAEAEALAAAANVGFLAWSSTTTTRRAGAR